MKFQMSDLGDFDSNAGDFDFDFEDKVWLCDLFRDFLVFIILFLFFSSLTNHLKAVRNVADQNRTLVASLQMNLMIGPLVEF